MEGTKLSPIEMADFQKWALYYSYDEKYNPSHKSTKQKLFHIDVTPSTDSEGLIIVDIAKVEMADHTPPK